MIRHTLNTILSQYQTEFEKNSGFIIDAFRRI